MGKSTVIYVCLGTFCEKLFPQLGSWLGGAPGGLPGPILEPFWDAFGANLEPPGTSEIVLPSRREHVSHQNRVLRADFALGGAPGPILEAFWRIFDRFSRPRRTHDGPKSRQECPKSRPRGGKRVRKGLLFRSRSSGGSRGRFWSLRGSILEHPGRPPGAILDKVSNDLQVRRCERGVPTSNRRRGRVAPEQGYKAIGDSTRLLSRSSGGPRHSRLAPLWWSCRSAAGCSCCSRCYRRACNACTLSRLTRFPLHDSQVSKTLLPCACQ